MADSLLSTRFPTGATAGPEPITMTSNIYTPLLCLKVGEPAQGPESGHKAIFTPPRHNEPLEALKTFANRPPWDCEAVPLCVRPDDWILRVPSPKEHPVVNQLALTEAKFSTKFDSDELG